MTSLKKNVKLKQRGNKWKIEEGSVWKKVMVATTIVVVRWHFEKKKIVELIIGVKKNLKTIFPFLFIIFCCYFDSKCHMYVVYWWICHVTMNVLHSFYTFRWLSKKILDGSNSSWNKCSIGTCHSWGVQMKYADNFKVSSIT